jgi:hypothetical protein
MFLHTGVCKNIHHLGLAALAARFTRFLPWSLARRTLALQFL